MATAEIDLEIERPCGKCYGTGKDPSQVLTPCSACKGIGSFPTALGDSIITMLKKYWRLEDIQR